MDIFSSLFLCLEKTNKQYQFCKNMRFYTCLLFAYDFGTVRKYNGGIHIETDQKPRLRSRFFIVIKESGKQNVIA